MKVTHTIGKKLFGISLLSLFVWSSSNGNQVSVNKSVSLYREPSVHSSLLKKTSDSLSIQYIDLQTNPLLFSEVKKYIKEQQDSCQLFKNGFGYVTIGGIKLVRTGSPIPAESLKEQAKDIEVEFNLGLSSLYPTQGFGKPLYYSYVDTKLVLVYDQNVRWINCNSYSASSEKKVKKLIEQTLIQAFEPEFEFKEINGNTFVLTPERREPMSHEQVLEMASSTLQKLKTVVEYVDGTISYRYIRLGKVR